MAQILKLSNHDTLKKTKTKKPLLLIGSSPEIYPAN